MKLNIYLITFLNYKNKSLITLILSIGLISNVYSNNITMKYGGDWVNTTVVQNDDYYSMAGSFVGTNLMKLGDEEIATNFKCTGIYQTAPAAMSAGSCNMKQAGTEDFWVLSWQCTDGAGKSDCKGTVLGGTGRFKGVTGNLQWIDIAGFGEGKGTFKLN